MTRAEGQTIPPDYTLVRQLQQGPNDECWLAADKATGERLFIRFYPADTANWQEALARQADYRGLVHENIARTAYISAEGGDKYLALPYYQDGERFTPDGKPQTRLLALLRQLISALQYSHQLGIAHGQLHPGNLIVDSAGQLHITGYGLPAKLALSEEDASFLSPEARKATLPDISDDIYSLGCIIFWCLAGKRYSPGIELDAPLPSKLALLLDAMLKPVSYERSLDLKDLQQALTQHFEGEDNNTIAQVSFTRPGAAGQEQEIDATPAAADEFRQGRQERQVPVLVVLVALAGALLVASLVFLALPKDTPQPVVGTPNSYPGASPSNPAGQGAAPSPLPPYRQAQLKAIQEEAIQVTKDILRLEVELEDMGAQLWAAYDLATIGPQLEAADELFRTQDYEAALTGYEAVKAALAAIKASKDEILAARIQAGDAALAAADPEGAISAFTMAAAIDPQNQSLKQRLAKAESLTELLKLMDQAKALEREGQLEQALHSYQQAVTLNAEWQAATDGVQRVTASIRQAKFTDFMTLGFAALAAKDYAAARNAFTQAGGIFPDSTDPENGLAQVTLTENTDFIAAQREQAQAALAKDDWAQAITAYEAALARDASLIFATKGLAYVQERQKVENELKRFINDPTLLQADDQLKAATATLATAYRFNSKSQKTQDYINTLSRLISGARVELPVLVTSDNRTDITIYRVGHLGKLASKELQLIPGRYTLVGKRRGYRDVRHELALLPTQSNPATVHIACDERI